MVVMADLAAAQGAAVEALLWSHDFDAEEMSTISRRQLESEVGSFYVVAGDAIRASKLDPEQVGHDFILSRNGEGAGFWDRNLGAVGDDLHATAQLFGERHAYVGDDGFIWTD
jgi:hypothetical protein